MLPSGNFRYCHRSAYLQCVALDSAIHRGRVKSAFSCIRCSSIACPTVTLVIKSSLYRDALYGSSKRISGRLCCFATPPRVDQCYERSFSVSPIRFVQVSYIKELINKEEESRCHPTRNRARISSAS